jgi:hypothetical protein
MQGNLIDRFMSIDNQIYLNKVIYQLHKDNGGTLPYTHFKSIVGKQMAIWLKNIRFGWDMTLGGLNDAFCTQNANIYERNNVNGIDLEADANVYRLGTNITSYDENDNIVSEVKSFKNLMAADYGSINVWREINVTNDQAKYRNNNRIQVDRRSRHIRHNDRTPGGYHASAEESSLNGISRGYGNAMTDLIKKHEDLRNSYNKVLF